MSLSLRSCLPLLDLFLCPPVCASRAGHWPHGVLINLCAVLEPRLAGTHTGCDYTITGKHKLGMGTSSILWVKSLTCQYMCYWSYFNINRRDYRVIFSIFRQCANNSICSVFTVTLWTSTDFLSTTTIKCSLFIPYLHQQLTPNVIIISCLGNLNVNVSFSILSQQNACWLTMKTVIVQSYLWWQRYKDSSPDFSLWPSLPLSAGI